MVQLTCSVVLEIGRGPWIYIVYVGNLLCACSLYSLIDSTPICCLRKKRNLGAGYSYPAAILKKNVDWRRTSPSLIFISASDEEISVKTPAFKMTAALTHACQMLELMAFYLDVNLPKRISYRYCEHFFCTLKILSSIFMKQHWTIYKFICWFIL